MKTQSLKQALDEYGFDLAFGGARRDEEKSRAKEYFRSGQPLTSGIQRTKGQNSGTCTIAV